MNLLERLKVITSKLEDMTNKAQKTRDGEDIFRAVIVEQAGNRLGDPHMARRLMTMEITGIYDPIALKALETTERLVKWAEEDSLRLFVEE